MNNKIKLLFSASEIDALLSKINSGNVLTDTELLKLQNLDTSVFATKTDLHTHTNKSVIDGITAEKVASWNSKSTFSGDYNDLANKPTIPAAYNLPVANQNTLGGIKVGAGLSITADGILSATGGGTADSVEWESVIGRPTRLSDFTNDSGFITGVPDEYVTETELNAKGYLTEHQDISGLALKSELHSHSNKSVIDAITSAMTTKWNKSIPFEDSYVDNCDNWLTNGYTKTSTSTTNHPSVCTGVDRWGVLFYISENTTNGTGMQMYFPIDGTYAGRVFTRRIVNRNAGTWNLMSNFDGNYENLTNKPTIPSIDGLATETYVDSAIANASLGGGGSVDTSGFALKSELHEHTNKAVIDTITSSMITAWNNKSDFSGDYDDLTNKPTIPTVTNDLTTTLKNNYDAAYNHSQEHHFSGDYNDLDNKPTIPTAYTHPATHPASMITGLSTVATSGSYADLADTPVIPAAYVHPDTHPATMIIGLADVATTGSYNDLTNKPTIPSIDGLASTTYVDNKVAGIVNSAPETLDTLKELATALGNDANFATTVSNQIGSKVDKVDGKGLSTNDLTNALKANYDTAYTHSQSAHAPSNAQKNSDITKAEIEAKLTGNITSHTHSQYLTEHQSLTGYAKTANLAKVATSGSYNDLTNKPIIPSEYNLPIASQTTLGGIKVGAGLSITAEGVLSATGGGTADSVNWENVVGKPTFATVATTGSYNDLTNKPTIPEAGIPSLVGSNENIVKIWELEDGVYNLSGILKYRYDYYSTETGGTLEGWQIEGLYIIYNAGDDPDNEGRTIKICKNLKYNFYFKYSLLNGTIESSRYDPEYIREDNSNPIGEEEAIIVLPSELTGADYYNLPAGVYRVTASLSFEADTNCDLRNGITSDLLALPDGSIINSNGSGQIINLTYSFYLILNDTGKVCGAGSSNNAWTGELATVATSGDYNDLTNKPTIPTAYTHPDTHPASMITGLSTVATSGSYADLTNKPTIPTVTNDLTDTLKSNYDTAYTHSQSAHAPSNAQKNSDITKSEIEAKLTGNITTHTHSQYLTSIPSEYITEQELTSKGYATATTREEVKTTVNQILGGAYIE